MVVKKIQSNLLDVFWGFGWDNWARISIKKGFVTQESGKSIPKVIFSQLIATYGGKSNHAA